MIDVFIATKHINKRGRASGGIVIVMKKDIKRAVKIFKETNYGIWLTICKYICKCEKAAYLWGTYIHPLANPYAIGEPFDILESDIADLPDNCKGIIMGDMNARYF